mmetsp:Transcript_40524/g.126747  ORF Transcript_40524/g.126747 Transcript_40524/m.126747 type:complete len:487 (-) Transcript_40524:102-1562(-)|eukprot:CAMPEP_0118856812 /NCGR_PEP_ID=MMETSP1163-20130328/4114_1 /TAXON_ID=124430 /ORGANISM="Phaeomonas parva, Strain CCMP2877" /LENGTH=486 /DNA_ID=CAMNT_0006789989 /DNA_START=268 /DNA_END=1728 /DNA_ORIENTATION=+
MSLAAAWRRYYDDDHYPYYHNGQSGETVWERPADYETDDDDVDDDNEEEEEEETLAETANLQIEPSLAAEPPAPVSPCPPAPPAEEFEPRPSHIAVSRPVQEDSDEDAFGGLDTDCELGIAWEGVGFLGDEAEGELVDCISGEDPGKAAEQRLHAIVTLLQTVGSEDEWAQLVKSDGYAAPARLLNFLTPGVPPAVATAAAQILVLFATLDAKMWEKQSPAACVAAAQSCLEGIGVAHAKALDTSAQAADEELGAWLTCLRDILVSGFDYDVEIASDSKRSRRRAAIREDIRKGISAAQGAKVIIDAMVEATEEVFLWCVRCLVALSALQDEGGAGNAVFAAVENAASASHEVGEGLLHIYNDVATPDREADYEQVRDAYLMLRFCRDLFHDSATATLLLTNDMMVLVDILLRAIQDLPAEEPLREDALLVLKGLLVNSTWPERQYRKDEIRDTLESLASMDGKRIFEGVPELATAILEDNKAALA